MAHLLSSSVIKVDASRMEPLKFEEDKKEQAVDIDVLWLVSLFKICYHLHAFEFS